MNKKQTTAFAMIAMVFGVMTSPIVTAEDAFAVRVPDPQTIIQGDLTAPSGDKPFGGEVTGDFSVSVYGDQSPNWVLSEKTKIIAQIDSLPTPGTVYEGWLVDVDSGEKSSIGIFNDNTQRKVSSLHTTVENNLEYDLIVITEEPHNDANPAPDTPVAGVVLEAPFGQ